MKKKWFMFKIKFLKRAKGESLNKPPPPPIKMNYEGGGGVLMYKFPPNFLKIENK